jgi:mannose-6-phosphate isomerase-like protein (cupin superfamily)
MSQLTTITEEKVQNIVPMLTLQDVLDKIGTPTTEKILALQDAVCNLPPVENMITDHYFSGGMYCRRVWRPAGTIIVGKVHKKDHFFMCVSGEIIAWTENGMRTLKAGDIVESKAGTKRATLALTDAIGVTFHVTDKRDFDELEADLVELDDNARLDFNNKPKISLLKEDKRNLL